jgi:hypothetical protein
MTKDLINHCDNILKFVSKRQSTPIFDNEINVEFKTLYGCNLSEAFGLVGNDLESKYKFIDLVGSSKNILILTMEGEEAAKKGIEKYFNDIEYFKTLSIKANGLSIKANIASIKSVGLAKIGIALSVAAILIAIGLFFADKFWDVSSKSDKDTKDSKNYSNIVIDKCDSITPSNYVATGLIKVKSDSIDKSSKKH